MVQTIVNTGVEWTYDNLSDIQYDSYRMSRPYDSWYYDIFSTYTESGDVLGVSDSSNRKYTKVVLDDVVITDDYENKPKKTIVDNFSVGQGDDPKKIRYTTVEKLKLDGNVERFLLNTKNDSFSLSENNNVKLKKSISEGEISFSGNYNREVVINTKESYSISDVYNRIATKVETEFPMYVVDSDERRGASVLYDFELFNSDGFAYQSDFDTYSNNYTPIGYSELQPLIPGEYEYKDAYVGVKLSLPPTNGRFGIIDGRLNVDVEDTVVRDSVEINVTEENEGIIVYKFDKKYYTVPQIQYRIVYSDADCQVDLKEITKDGFKMGLKKIGTNEYVNGMVDFLAIGY